MQQSAAGRKWATRIEITASARGRGEFRRWNFTWLGQIARSCVSGGYEAIVPPCVIRSVASPVHLSLAYVPEKRVHV